MKKIFLYLSAILISGIVLFSSCSDDKIDESIPVSPVLQPFLSVVAEDGETTANAIISDRERTILFDLNQFKSIKEVKVRLNLSKRAILVAPADTVLTLDMREPHEIVVDNLIDKVTYTLSALDFLSVTELWRKTGSLMDFSNHNNRSVGISGDYLVVHDRSAKGANRYYDLETGEEAGVLSNEGVDIDALHMITDDAGNIVTGSFTPNTGSELKVFWWKGVKADPELLLTWTSDAPDNIGRKFYAKGDMNKLAYLYATVSNNSMFYRWEIKDGKVTSATPDKIEFTHPNEGGWGINGKIVPVSVGKNSNYFINSSRVVRITYMNGEENTAIYNSEAHIEGVFHQWLNNGGHAFDYVDMNGERYMFIIEQNDKEWFNSTFTLKKMMNDPSSIKDITSLIYNRGWNAWLDFPMDPNLATNGNVTGEVKARVSDDGKSAIVAFIATNGGVKVLRVATE